MGVGKSRLSYTTSTVIGPTTGLRITFRAHNRLPHIRTHDRLRGQPLAKKWRRLVRDLTEVSPRKVHVLRPYPGGRTFCGRDPSQGEDRPPRVAHVRAMPPVARRRGRYWRAALADGLAARDWPKSPD